MVSGERGKPKPEVTHDGIHANRYGTKKPPFVLTVDKTVRDWSHPVMVKVDVGNTVGCLL